MRMSRKKYKSKTLQRPAVGYVVSVILTNHIILGTHIVGCSLSQRYAANLVRITVAYSLTRFSGGINA